MSGFHFEWPEFPRAGVTVTKTESESTAKTTVEHTGTAGPSPVAEQWRQADRQNRIRRVAEALFVQSADVGFDSGDDTTAMEAISAAELFEKAWEARTARKAPYKAPAVTTYAPVGGAK